MREQTLTKRSNTLRAEGKLQTRGVRDVLGVAAAVFVRGRLLQQPLEHIAAQQRAEHALRGAVAAWRRGLGPRQGT